MHVESWVTVMTLPAESRKGGLAASTIRTRFNYVHMALAAAGAGPTDRGEPRDRRLDPEAAAA